MKQCQSFRYRLDAEGKWQATRCAKHATATLSKLTHDIDLCTVHLGSALIYGGVWFMDEDGETWKLDMPAIYPLKDDAA